MDALAITDGTLGGKRGKLSPLAARIDSVEWAATALRERLLGAIGGGQSAAGAGGRPWWRRRPGTEDVRAETAALDAVLRRVHAVARDVHAQWQDGDDVADAMNRLGSALSVAAEFDA